MLVLPPQVEITLRGYAAYDIAEPETISLVVPAAALRSGGAVAADIGGAWAFTGGFVIAAARGSAVLAGKQAESRPNPP